MSDVSVRTKKTAYNALIGTVTQILIVLLNFISRTIFIRYLSVEYLGINGLFANILTILSFAELGIGEAMVYAMYKPMKNNDHNKLSALMNEYKRAYRTIAIVVGVLGFLISFFLDNIVSGKPNIPENFQMLFLLYLCNTVASYCLTYKKSILYVDLKRYITLYFQIAFVVLQLLLQWIVLLLFKNFTMYLLVQILCTILSNIAVSIYADKKYPYIKNKKNKLCSDDRKDIYANVKSLAITKIAGVVGGGTDNIIASNIVGLVIVGLVSNYTLIINAINGLLWSVLYGITNSIGDFNADSDINRRRKIFDQLYLASFIVFCIIGACIVSLINPFINIWIGSKYVISPVVAYSLVLSVFIGGINYAAYSFRVTLGIFKEVQWFYVSYAVINIFLSIWWGKKWGVAGIFLATSVSRFFTAELADGYFVSKKCLGRNPIFYYLKDAGTIFAFTMLCIISSIVVSKITVGGIIGFGLKAVASLLINSFVVIAIAWHRVEFSELMIRAKGLLKIRT